MPKRLFSLRDRSKQDWLFWSLLLLMLSSWIFGGVTQDDSPADDGLQLLALPVLLLGFARLLETDVSPRAQVGLACAGLILLVPLLQFLPIPPSWWGMPAMRQGLNADLQIAGAALQPHWSLTPAGTERGLWSMLPALAAFVAALSLGQDKGRRVVQAILVLVFCNALFAFFQVGLPRDSDLKLYSDFNAGFGGVLANTNHQATALIIAMVLAIGLAVDAAVRGRSGQARPYASAWYAAFAVFCLLLIPLTTARAGLVIALPAAAGVLFLSGALRNLAARKPGRFALLAMAALAVAVVAIRAALGWMTVDQAEELRHTIALATFGMGKAQSPLGGGLGSFVPLFELDAPPALWLSKYVNHAHNEYVQWWLTTGWLGMGVLAAVCAFLLLTGIALARSRGNKALPAACLVALLAVLAHSWADYPMRTTTLMTTTALLAGLMVAACADLRPGDDRRRSRKTDAGNIQPA